MTNDKQQQWREWRKGEPVKLDIQREGLSYFYLEPCPVRKGKHHLTAGGGLRDFICREESQITRQAPESRTELGFHGSTEQLEAFVKEHVEPLLSVPQPAPDDAPEPPAPLPFHSEAANAILADFVKDEPLPPEGDAPEPPAGEKISRCRDTQPRPSISITRLTAGAENERNDRALLEAFAAWWNTCSLNRLVEATDIDRFLTAQRQGSSDHDDH